MKFARYLQDTQTPEWEKAYIDYHGLKALLRVIRAQALQQVDTSSSFGNTQSDHTHQHDTNVEVEDDESEEDLSCGTTTSAHAANLWVSGVDHMTNDSLGQSTDKPVSFMRKNNNERIPSLSLAMASLPHAAGTASNVPPQQTPPSSRTHRTAVLPRSQDPKSRSQPPLNTILSNLPAIHGKFFDMMDAELGKVSAFYAEKEKEMHERSKLLRKQFGKLAVHRQLFYESFAHSEAQGWAKRACLSVPLLLSTWFPNPKPQEPRQTGGNGILASELGRSGCYRFVDTSNFATRAPEHRCLGWDHSEPRREDGVARGVVEKVLATAPARTLDDTSRIPHKRSDARPSISVAGKDYSLDPRAYKRAKKQLRKAIAEHYRGLEALNNYRTVNLTGFRKTLRKYGNITQIEFVLEVYMKEKVAPSAIASGATVGALLKEMEQVFATRFARGDRKKARDHLRVGLLPKTHNLSTLRFGLWLGLAIPAIVAGSSLSFQEYTRRTLPSWNILLIVYSTFIIPVSLVLLAGINIIIWARNKINYVFIFKLNPRLRHDYQGYFELPSFLLCTLAYGFWFSMAQLGPPMLWPLIWLALTAVVMFNPYHRFMWGGTRWWTIKKLAKLGASGIWNVEFTDLWLGDQFCSLVYPLCNLFFVGCFYARYNLLSSAHNLRAQEVFSRCGMARNWGWYFFLGMLPFLARVVQSLRRYRDTKLPEHLINAGKYTMGMISFFFYCYWRHFDRPNTGKTYIFFCFTSTVNSLYSLIWEVVVDWSMCQPYAHYPLLRRDLVFKTHISVYYFSLVSDLFLRFLWLLYISFDNTSFELRVFIAAMLETFRRAQWNIYRVENKHLANMEEYRATRELPLPYHFEAQPTEEEAYIARVQLRKRLARLSRASERV